MMNNKMQYIHHKVHYQEENKKIKYDTPRNACGKLNITLLPQQESRKGDAGIDKQGKKSRTRFFCCDLQFHGAVEAPLNEITNEHNTGYDQQVFEQEEKEGRKRAQCI